MRIPSTLPTPPVAHLTGITFTPEPPPERLSTLADFVRLHAGHLRWAHTLSAQQLWPEVQKAWQEQRHRDAVVLCHRLVDRRTADMGPVCAAIGKHYLDCSDNTGAEWELSLMARQAAFDLGALQDCNDVCKLANDFGRNKHRRRGVAILEQHLKGAESAHLWGELGNEALMLGLSRFRSKKREAALKTALQAYTQALRLAPHDPVLLENQAVLKVVNSNRPIPMDSEYLAYGSPDLPAFMGACGRTRDAVRWSLECNKTYTESDGGRVPTHHECTRYGNVAVIGELDALPAFTYDVSSKRPVSQSGTPFLPTPSSPLGASSVRWQRR